MEMLEKVLFNQEAANTTLKDTESDILDLQGQLETQQRLLISTVKSLQNIINNHKTEKVAGVEREKNIQVLSDQIDEQQMLLQTIRKEMQRIFVSENNTMDSIAKLERKKANDLLLNTKGNKRQRKLLNQTLVELEMSKDSFQILKIKYIQVIRHYVISYLASQLLVINVRK